MLTDKLHCSEKVTDQNGFTKLGQFTSTKNIHITCNHTSAISRWTTNFEDLKEKKNIHKNLTKQRKKDKDHKGMPKFHYSGKILNLGNVSMKVKVTHLYGNKKCWTRCQLCASMDLVNPQKRLFSMLKYLHADYKKTTTTAMPMATLRVSLKKTIDMRKFQILFSLILMSSVENSNILVKM